MSLAPVIRRLVAIQDNTVPVYEVTAMNTLVNTAASQPRFQALILTSFSALAVLLSAVGLYAALSCMVTQRSAELGLRMALGAQRWNVLGLEVSRGLILTAAGLGIGLCLAIFLARSISGFLFEVQPFDPAALALSVSVIFAVASLASSAPAWRASRLDPIETLRQQ